MRYRTFIIEHDENTGAYKYFQDSDIKSIRNNIMYADTVKEAKEDIDEIWEFDPKDV